MEHLPRRIDVHFHNIPPFYTEAARASGAMPDAAWCAKEAELVKPLAY